MAQISAVMLFIRASAVSISSELAFQSSRELIVARISWLACCSSGRCVLVNVSYGRWAISAAFVARYACWRGGKRRTVRAISCGDLGPQASCLCGCRSSSWAWGMMTILLQVCV